jgi:hypothetical protein
MLVISTLIGIIIGILIVKFWPVIIKQFVIKPTHRYKITFHGFFPIHEMGNMKNTFAETNSVTIVVSAKSESEAEKFLVNMVESEFRIEIENIDVI